MKSLMFILFFFFFSNHMKGIDFDPLSNTGNRDAMLMMRISELQFKSFKAEEVSEIGGVKILKITGIKHVLLIAKKERYYLVSYRFLNAEKAISGSLRKWQLLINYKKDDGEDHSFILDLNNEKVLFVSVYPRK